MPLYDIRCETGHKSERFIPLVKFAEPIVCACGSPASRVISAPMFAVDHTDYNCPVTGDHISSLSAHRDNLAKHGCRVLETGEREQFVARTAAAEAAMEKSLDETVEKTIDSWPSDKKETLHNELVNGKLDLSVERT